MLSNHHNQNMSSFRIIEPKPYQQAQQVPLAAAQQQVPIISNTTQRTTTPTNTMPSTNSSPMAMKHQMANGSWTNGTSSSGVGTSLATFSAHELNNLNGNSNIGINNNNNQLLQQSSVSIANSLSHQQLYQQQPTQHQQYNQQQQALFNQQVPHPHASLHHLHTPRIRNLSDTDSSCIPGT